MARVLYEGVIEKHPSTRLRLGARSNLVENHAFESEICKVQAGGEDSLNAAERKSMQKLTSSDVVIENEEVQNESLSFADRLLKRHRFSTVPKKSKYIDLRFILATSNICERLFSLAGYAMGSRRMGVLPTNIESQLFLNVNSMLWGIQDVHDMLA